MSPTGVPVTHLEIPAIYCPIPFAVHPEHQQIKQRSMAFLERYGLLGDERRRAQAVGSNAAAAAVLCLPSGKTEVVQIGADLAVFGLAFDDDMAEWQGMSGRCALMAELMPRVVRTLEHPDSGLLDGLGPFADAYCDIAKRYRAVAGPGTMTRWVTGHQNWWNGMLWELACMETGKMPDLNAYTYMRIGAVAGTTYMPLVEQLVDHAIPESEMLSPPTRALTEMASLLNGFHNDLFSCVVERVNPNQDEGARPSPNLVEVLIQEDHLSFELALQKAADYTNRMMWLFLRLSEKTSQGGSQELRSYLDGLKAEVRGCISFHVEPQQTLRYTHFRATSPLAVQPRGTVTETPPPGAEEPLPIPSIRWWWDLL
ncbi:hypothetical protein ABT234_40730 [Streptomyces sp. NPDC001586]|uniref:terpene synthase family protein n=1 Tax=Streptomyces sp. NPDC001586 TaxID=3154387 RepID=UPI0033164FF7